MSGDLDGLMRETMLDRANGLTGKSVIHPLHIAPVHALAVVPHEEYLDALDVARPGVGRRRCPRSGYGNKMNEMRPHRIWAERTTAAGARCSAWPPRHLARRHHGHALQEADDVVQRRTSPARAPRGWADREIGIVLTDQRFAGRI